MKFGSSWQISCTILSMNLVKLNSPEYSPVSEISFTAEIFLVVSVVFPWINTFMVRTIVLCPG